MLGILFGPGDLLGLKVEVISIISSFSQGDLKNESWKGDGKYSKNISCENDTSDLAFGANEQKKLLKVFAMVYGSVTVWYQGQVLDKDVKRHKEREIS